MGMFDYIRIEGHELPGLNRELLRESQKDNESLAEEPTIFQTKDLENYLGVYVIRDGRLFERIYEREEVPEEERPYYGKPEWHEGGRVFSRDYYRRVGSKKVVGHRDMYLDHHGDILFYASKKNLRLAEEHGEGLVEFTARFTHGNLEWIRPVRQ